MDEVKDPDLGEESEADALFEAHVRLLLPLERRVEAAKAANNSSNNSKQGGNFIASGVLAWDALPPGLQRDADTSVRLLEAAAALGHKRAQFELGRLLFDGIDGP